MRLKTKSRPNSPVEKMPFRVAELPAPQAGRISALVIEPETDFPSQPPFLALLEAKMALLGRIK